MCVYIPKVAVEQSNISQEVTLTSQTHMRSRQHEGLLMICGGCVSQLPGKHALTIITKKSYEAHGVLGQVTTGREAVKHGTNTAKASCRWSFNALNEGY